MSKIILSVCYVILVTVAVLEKHHFGSADMCINPTHNIAFNSSKLFFFIFGILTIFVNLWGIYFVLTNYNLQSKRLICEKANQIKDL